MVSRDRMIEQLKSLAAAARSSSASDRIRALATQIEKRQIALDPGSIVLRTSSIEARAKRSADEIELPARRVLTRRRSNGK